MKLGFGLSLEQTQKLIMTPELRQAITVLQLSALELNDYLEQELEENPLLEVKDEHAERETEQQSSVESVESVENEEKEKEEKFDIDWQEYFNDRSDLGYIKQPSVKKEEDEGYSYENFLSQAPTLEEHLILQLSLVATKQNDKKIGEFLIGNLDNHGYLRVSLEEVAKIFRISEEKVEEVLKLIQTFDPIGVGARDLSECLLLQLEHRSENSEILKQLIKKHLEDLAAGRFNKLAALFNTTASKIQKEADVIKTLDPKPGRKFASANEVRYVVPDVVVERVDGEYIVLVNDVNIPRLAINNKYKSILRQDQLDPNAKQFVEGKLNSAAWLIKSIEQRRLTLYKVVNTIVELQREFLDKGVKYLKPMTLKRVADIIEMHESTVSRATSNKYIQTPGGVFELKYFFTSGIPSSGGESTSSQCIKKTIQELIKAEDPQKPLSDQKIGDILKEQGIKISRRTVAKYRDELGIPSTVQRKRY